MTTKEQLIGYYKNLSHEPHTEKEDILINDIIIRLQSLQDTTEKPQQSDEWIDKVLWEINSVGVDENLLSTEQSQVARKVLKYFLPRQVEKEVIRKRIEICEGDLCHYKDDSCDCGMKIRYGYNFCPHCCVKIVWIA